MRLVRIFISSETYIMKPPRLSGRFNNCALHALTPKLTHEVFQFAAVDEYDNGYKAGYAALKDTFADFYGFDKEEFTWNTFAGILRRYNPFDRQMILGLVLRQYMRKNMEQASEDPDEIKHLTELNDNGRYQSLEAWELYNNLAKFLGQRITVIPTSGDKFAFFEEDTVNLQTEIVMYHVSSGHWELVADAQTQARNYQDEQTTQLVNIMDLVNGQSSFFSACRELLQQHIQLTAELVEGNTNLNDKFYEIIKSTTQISKFIFADGMAVAKEAVITMLGEEITPAAKALINNYTQDTHILYDASVDHLDDTIKQAFSNLEYPHLAKEYFDKYVVQSGEVKEPAVKVKAPAAKVKPSETENTFDRDFLKQYQPQLDCLYSKFQEQCVLLEIKASRDSNYTKASNAAMILQEALNAAKDKLKNANGLAQFIDEYQQAISIARPAFAEHRSYWSNNIHPILKAILGVFAAILVIPAAVVVFSSSHGYQQTFFGSPPTRSTEKLEEFATEMNALFVSPE